MTGGDAQRTRRTTSGVGHTQRSCSPTVLEFDGFIYSPLISPSGGYLLARPASRNVTLRPLSGPGPSWTASFAQGTLNTSPAFLEISGGSALVANLAAGGINSSIAAFTATSGSPLWRTLGIRGTSSPLASADGTELFGLGLMNGSSLANGPVRFYALNASDGAMLRNFTIPPECDGDVLTLGLPVGSGRRPELAYVSPHTPRYADQRHVCALSLTNQTMLWAYDIGIFSATSTDDSMVTLCDGGESLLVLGRKPAFPADDWQGSPFTQAQMLLSLDAATGQRRWYFPDEARWPWSGMRGNDGTGNATQVIEYISPPALGQPGLSAGFPPLAYVSAWLRGTPGSGAPAALHVIFAIDVRNGDQVWNLTRVVPSGPSARTPGWRGLSAPSVDAIGNVFVAAAGSVVGVNGSTGLPLWDCALLDDAGIEGPPSSVYNPSLFSPAITPGGTLYMGSDTGYLMGLGLGSALEPAVPSGTSTRSRTTTPTRTLSASVSPTAGAVSGTATARGTFSPTPSANATGLRDAPGGPGSPSRTGPDTGAIIAPLVVVLLLGSVAAAFYARQKGWCDREEDGSSPPSAHHGRSPVSARDVVAVSNPAAIMIPSNAVHVVRTRSASSRSISPTAAAHQRHSYGPSPAYGASAAASGAGGTGGLSLGLGGAGGGFGLPGPAYAGMAPFHREGSGNYTGRALDLHHHHHPQLQHPQFGYSGGPQQQAEQWHDSSHVSGWQPRSSRPGSTRNPLTGLSK